MTKTELRLKAGVSTNIIAKMGKGEPISMDNLAKITLALNCGFDDIVEILSDTQPKEITDKKQKEYTINELEDSLELQYYLDGIESYKQNPVTYTSEQVMQELGITQEELDAITLEEMEKFRKKTNV